MSRVLMLALLNDGVAVSSALYEHHLGPGAPKEKLNHEHGIFSARSYMIMKAVTNDPRSTHLRSLFSVCIVGGSYCALSFTPYCIRCLLSSCIVGHANLSPFWALFCYLRSTMPDLCCLAARMRKNNHATLRGRRTALSSAARSEEDWRSNGSS